MESVFQKFSWTARNVYSLALEMLQVVEYLQTLPVWADLRDMAVAVHFVEHSEGRWWVWPIFDGLCPIKRTKTILFFKHDWLNQNVKMPRTQNDVDSLKLILLKVLFCLFPAGSLLPKYQQDDEKDHGSSYRLVGQSLGVT